MFETHRLIVPQVNDVARGNLGWHTGDVDYQ
ncbi:MAG: hypothetical protein RLZZ626_1153, partial [Actinomycetota bacterium]